MTRGFDGQFSAAGYCSPRLIAADLTDTRRGVGEIVGGSVVVIGTSDPTGLHRSHLFQSGIFNLLENTINSGYK